MDIRKLSIAHLPFLRILMVYLLGLIIGSEISWTQNLQIHFLIVGFFGLVILLILQAFGERKFLIVSSYLTLFILSLLSSSNNCAIGYNDSSKSGQFIAEVTSNPHETKHQIRVQVLLKKQLVDSNVHQMQIPALAIFWKKGKYFTDYARGDVIQFDGEISAIQIPLNPLEFNYSNYLKGKSIRYQVVGSSRNFQLLSKSKQWSLIGIGYQLQNKLAKKLKHYFEDEEVFQVMAAISIGLRVNFSDELLKTFVNTGTVHVLSVSGMHVGLLYMILTMLLKPIDYLRHGRSIRFWLIITFIWIYALICGFSPAVLRATVMYSLLLYGYWRHHAIISYNLLFASAWILLMIDPNMRYDIGFQLSYLAVLGIMVFVPIFQKIFYSKKKWKQVLYNLVYSCIAAQLVTSPLTLYYFHQFPFYFLIANIFMAIPSAVILYLGFTILLSPVHAFNETIAYWATVVIEGTTNFLNFIISLPLSSFQGLDISFGMMLLSYFAILMLLFSYIFYQRHIFLISHLIVFVVLIWYFTILFDEHRFEGLTFYHLKKEIAISYVNKGDLLLFSTLDSMNHNQLNYSVWPSLTKYYKFKSFEDSQYVRLGDDKFSNKLLSVAGNLKVFILNKFSSDIPEVDVVLVRNNSEFEFANPIKMCILDASNNDDFIQLMRIKLDSLACPYYILKDNFAYVWNR